VHHLGVLMNEVFGEENFVECFIWKRSSESKSAGLVCPSKTCVGVAVSARCGLRPAPFGREDRRKKLFGANSHRRETMKEDSVGRITCPATLSAG
jgi:hypothetical protein